jgi:N-acetylmuramoyl-L-alanine amidase
VQLKHNSKIGQATVIVDIIPKGYVSTHSPNSQTSITIHNTGNPDATAIQHIGAIEGNNAHAGRQASWHFTVDDQHIVQHIDTAHEAWHTGVGDRGNKTSIGVEICEFKDPVRQRKAEDNAVALVKYLKANIKTAQRVCQHYDWSGKYCPRVLRARPNGWEDFLAKVAKEDRTMNLKDPEIDFILSVLSNYWTQMKGNKDVQNYTHFIANRVREEAGRDKT